MNTLTKEWLQNTITSIESARDEIPFGLDEDQNNMLTALKIALASLAAVSDERAAYELFMEKRFGESVDRRRAKNGDREYMAWDMALGWIIWCHRASMLQGKSEQPQNAQQNIPENIPGGNSPVTPDGWISCSDRMPNEEDVLVYCSDTKEQMVGFHKGKGLFQFFYMNGVEGVCEPSHWMPLPEPPQEVK
ncbi:DUF551 domain-containing protein [Escherichia coli O76:H7]